MKRRSPVRNFHRGLLGVLGLAVAFGLGARTPVAPPAPASSVLFKLVDKMGRVTYVDQVPKGFDGQVTRIEIDASTNTQQAAPAPAKGQEPGTVAAPKPDMATDRRALRERLAAELAAAREKLDAARKAREKGEDPLDEERQAIQQKFDASSARSGDTGPRPNCRYLVEPDGRPVWMCPTQVPGETFRNRIEKLDAAVRKAEEEVERAERNYRRNVD